MDADRFDDLLRSISETPSRRGVSQVLGGLAFGGALGFLGLVDAEADKKGKKGKKGKKKCKKKPTQALPPPPPSCIGQPDDAPCDGTGTCFQGGCVGRPTCSGYHTSCQPDNQVSATCCSGYCLGNGGPPGVCTQGKGGRACYETTDCETGHTCIGYRCLSNTL